MRRAACYSTSDAPSPLSVNPRFRYFGRKHGDKIFKLHGTLPPRHPNAKVWRFDAAKFEAWKWGKTGFPLVDANMRELAATGYMSNRGRQNVASFLALDMECDWRPAAEWFEEILIDHDVYSNYVSWAMAAGVSGGRVNKFNVVKQVSGGQKRATV